jgi:hypothetical protein
LDDLWGVVGHRRSSQVVNRKIRVNPVCRKYPVRLALIRRVGRFTSRSGSSYALNSLSSSSS